MATGKIDIRSLTPTQLVRLLNSTPLGPVVNSARVNRQMNEAGMRITAGDPRKVSLMKYVAWLARRHDEPKPQTLGYEEKLRRDLERQLVRSRHGRDIAPIPQVVDPKRKAACQDSFRLFCETYFPQAFHLAWSEDHLRVIGKIESAASTTQTKHRLAILNGDVLGMAGPGVKIAGFMTCTKIYHDDLADQMLDREKNPEWQGECTKMVYAFPSAPESEKLWDRYAELRAEGLREGDGGKRATEFYRENRQQMDAGAVVAWPDRYNDDELSAIQHAMNLKLRDEEAFFAEYQNEALTDQADEDVLTPDEVASRFNGRSRMIVPQSATCVTMFIDVHDRLLYYAVCAWEPDFTGHVIDYGTYPDQKRRFFTMRDATRTLASVMGGSGTPGVEGAIQSGLTALAGDHLGRSWQRTNEGALRIERCLIDSGYLPGVVANVCHVASAVTMPSKGMGIRAGNKPMSTYRRKPGERHGHYWYVPNVSRTSEFPHVQFDTNYWKTFVHSRLAQVPGDPGCLRNYLKTPNLADDYR